MDKYKDKFSINPCQLLSVAISIWLTNHLIFKTYTLEYRMMQNDVHQASVYG